METTVQLDYYYGAEAEQFSFFRIPRALFTLPVYKTVSSESKLLYGMMLDRMSLSLRNGWTDRANRVYIFFTLEDAMEQLNLGHNKVVRLFRELEDIGLIERKKRGQGKPTMIYVKNFISAQDAALAEDNSPEEPDAPIDTEADATDIEVDTPPVEAVSQTSDLGKSEQSPSQETCMDTSSKTVLVAPDRASGVSSTPSYLPMTGASPTCVSAASDAVREVQTSDFGKSALPQTGSLDFPKSEGNYTKSSYTEKKETEKRYTDHLIYPPAPPAPVETPQGQRHR